MPYFSHFIRMKKLIFQVFEVIIFIHDLIKIFITEFRYEVGM
jgi:hypothetical protein